MLYLKINILILEGYGTFRVTKPLEQPPLKLAFIQTSVQT